MRFVTSFAAALVCATIAVNAQDTVKTKTEGDQSKMVTYTGCLGAGTETRTFVLDKVVPVTTTKEVAGTGGTVAVTSTSYILIPGEKVVLQQHVGHKVEVTGMLIPEGDSKTKTKIEREKRPGHQDHDQGRERQAALPGDVGEAAA
jgi:hypothetical protein